MDIGKISLILGLVLTGTNVANWIYKYFNGAYKLKKGKQDLQEKVDKHDNEIVEFKNIINRLDDKLDGLFEVNKMQIRYLIVSGCTEALEQGYIEQYVLQSLEDLFTVYTNILKSNSYVCGLMKRVRHLEIRNGD